MDSKPVAALDCDGVLFNFTAGYGKVFREKFSIVIPPESPDFPAQWNYESAYATKAQVNKVWDHIHKDSYAFWRFLPAYDGVKEFLSKAQEKFDLVFITARSGSGAKKATEDALAVLGVKDPRVIIAHDKVPALVETGASVFVDDRDKNFEDILIHNMYAVGNQDSPLPPFEGSLLMLDKPWNRHFTHHDVKRIYSLEAVLE